MRNGHYKGWLPTLFVGNLLQNKTVGIVGAGRIGSAYARMMIEARATQLRSPRQPPAPAPLLSRPAAPFTHRCPQGHKMDLVYYDIYQNKKLEEYVTDYGKFLKSKGERTVKVTRCETVEDVLKLADVVSLHTVRLRPAHSALPAWLALSAGRPDEYVPPFPPQNLDATTTHLMNTQRLNMMKKDAVLVNAARGPVIDEKALVVRAPLRRSLRVRFCSCPLPAGPRVNRRR